MDRTLVIAKPDAVERGLVGEIISRFERRGLRVVALEMRMIDEATAARHYEEHHGKPFYGDLMVFITRGPAVLMVVEGPEDTWKVVRTMMGATNPRDAAPAPSVGISESSSRRTWSTAPTVRNPHNGRSGSSSRRCDFGQV